MIIQENSLSGLRQLQNMVLKVNEEVLRKNFLIVLRNFQIIEKRFCMGQEKFTTLFRSQVQAQAVLQEENLSKIQDLLSKIFKLEQVLSLTDSKIAQVCLNLAEMQSKMVQFQAYRKSQTKLLENEREKIQQQKVNIQQLFRVVGKIEENLPKKLQKGEFERSRKQLILLQKLVQFLKLRQQSLQRQMKSQVQVTEKSQLRSEQLVKQITSTVLNQIQPIYNIQLIKKQSFRELQKLQSPARLELSNKAFSDINQQIEDLQLKVQKLIESQKTSIKQRVQPKVIMNDLEPRPDKAVSFKIQELQTFMDISAKKIENFIFQLYTNEERIKECCFQRFDQRLKQVQVQYLSKFKSINELLDQKIFISEHAKNQRRILALIQAVEKRLQQKTDKYQVKKAFQFIDAQFKELITTVHQDDFQGLLIKTKPKCLSCDKIVQLPRSQAEKRKPLSKQSWHVSKQRKGSQLVRE